MESRLQNKAEFLEWASKQAVSGTDDAKRFFHFALEAFISHSEARGTYVSKEQYESYYSYIARHKEHFKDAWDVIAIAPASSELTSP